jgi:hypothetical protein
MSGDKCHWLVSWWHARLRESDRRFMVPAIIDAAAARTDLPRSDRALVAFRMFTLQPGQEHWRCPCSERDRQAVETKL